MIQLLKRYKKQKKSSSKLENTELMGVDKSSSTIDSDWKNSLILHGKQMLFRIWWTLVILLGFSQLICSALLLAQVINQVREVVNMLGLQPF